MARHTTLVRERYRLQARIGQGGGGAVFRARDVHTGQLVAIKLLTCTSARQRDAFAREAHLLAQLQHVGLPSVADYFTDGDNAFMVMTFVPGVDLAQQLSHRATPFAPRMVLGWANDVLEALGYLHMRQPPVIHGDVKPRNLKLDALGRAVLLDFGLARSAETDSSFSGYTLRYAPVEQVRGELTDARGDLFSLGATLYELLTRRSPVDALARAAAVDAGESDPLTPLRVLAPAVPASVAEVIERAMALRASARPPSARAMRAALDEAAHGPVTVLTEVAPAPATTPRAPPVGTVTFLATDVSARDVTHLDLARHDGRLRQAIETRGGLVFRTSASGIGAAFATAHSALDAALEAQRELRPLALRIALATGDAHRINGEYLSSVLPRLWRLLGTAHGGQIVLSDATRALVVGHLPAGLSFRDLGQHALPQLVEPEHVYQLVVGDLPADFPPLVAAEVRGPAAGVATTRPIGREPDLARVAEQLRLPSTRLLTLFGPAGVGKTTLALFVGESLLDDFAGGVFFVPLAAVRRAELVLPAIAETIGLPGESTLAAVAAAFGAHESMLVVDNLEHLLPLAAETLGQLLRACSTLTVLATSRVRLGLLDEHLWPVEPLAFARPSRLPNLADLASYPAIELFVARARAVEASLTLDAGSAPPIAQICARLDGLPLAIELAAARSDLFTPAALLQQLESGAAVLTARQVRRPPRQQTLRAALAWSYELLSPADQRLFATLGTFVGGWDLQAAEEVCGGSDDAGLVVARGLETLCASSLIRAAADGTRYEMLETIREYAVQRLERTADQKALRQRHAAYFVDLAEAGDAELGGPRMGAWVARLALEHPNLRGALAWLSATQPPDAGLRLAGALWRFWQVHGHVTEGRDWLDRLLQREANAQPSSARARALVGAGALAWRAQDTSAARGWLMSAREQCDALDDEAGLATALKYLGVMALKGPPPDHVAAGELFEASLQARRRLGDRDGIASCLNDLAVLARDQGDYARSRELLDESLVLCRALGNRYGLSFVLNNLSLVALHEGAYERVPELLRESLVLARELGSREKIACALTGLASLASVNAEPREAARLFGAADALRQTIGVPMSAAEQAAHERHLALARSSMDPAAWEAALREGHALDLEVLVDRALATPGV